MNAEMTLTQHLQMFTGEPLELEIYMQEMQEMNQAYIQDATQVIRQNSWEDLGKMLKSYRKLRKTIAKMSRMPNEGLAYECGIFIGAYKVLEEMNDGYLEQEEQQKYKELLHRRHVQDILEYLYKNPNARQGKIAEDVKIKPNYLSEILNLLLKAGYVQRYGKNKGTRYCLTRAGRCNCNWHKVHMKKEDEYVVDTTYTEILDKEQFWKERAEEYAGIDFKKEDIYEKCRNDFRFDEKAEPVLWWTVGKNYIGYIRSES